MMDTIKTQKQNISLLSVVNDISGNIFGNKFESKILESNGDSAFKLQVQKNKYDFNFKCLLLAAICFDVYKIVKYVYSSDKHLEHK